MDDGVDVEAQPGPIYVGDVGPEQSPVTCVDVAVSWALVAASLGWVAGGAVILAVLMPAAKTMADARKSTVVCGSLMIFIGSVMTAMSIRPVPEGCAEGAIAQGLQIIRAPNNCRSNTSI
jgi:hypothetical protein